jgi:hypothetical protein
MTRSHFPAWYRHAWWAPGICSVAALALVFSAVRPSEESVLLAAAILSALPWSLTLLLLNIDHGFGDLRRGRPGGVHHVAMLWWTTALLRARFRRGRRMSGRVLGGP